MEHPLQRDFENYIELKTALSGLDHSRFLDSHTASELSVIDLIGRIEAPCVTSIAEKLGMTRGAISKITRKLLDKDLIESYRMPGNNQKIYFRLKKDGQILFEKYAAWRDEEAPSDADFFDRYSEKKLHKIDKFMREYNEYLEERIKSSRH